MNPLDGQRIVGFYRRSLTSRFRGNQIFRFKQSVPSLELKVRAALHTFSFASFLFTASRIFIRLKGDINCELSRQTAEVLDVRDRYGLLLCSGL